MYDPHAEVEIKSQLKPKASVAEEEDPKPSHQLHKLGIKSAGPTRQTLCLWNIKKVIESSHKRKCTSSDCCGHWRQEHTGVGPGYNMSCPHSKSRVQHSAGGHPREERWTVTPSEEKDSNSSDSINMYYFYVLTCSVDSFEYFFFSSSSPPPLYCSC